MNILIVDDKEENRYLLKALLQGNGHTVLPAKNGAEALEKLKSGVVELIISDILMPVMDGFQLCRKVKTDETLRHIPLIIYTATYTGPKDEEFALKIGADRFIIKPCEPDVFMAAVQDVMSARRSDIAPTPPPEEEVLELYNERLVRKLEQKMLELEREVQARKEAEETLRQRNAFLELLLETIPAPIFYKNANGQYTGCNQAFEEFIGWRRAEIIGKSVYDMAPKEIADKYTEKDEELFKHPGKQRYAWKVMGKDGLREVIFNKASIPGNKNRIEGIIGAITDITEQKLVTEALAASERKYRMLAENTLDVIWAMNLDLTFTYANSAVRSLMGYLPEEWIGSRLSEHCDEENFAKMVKIITDEVARGPEGAGVILEAVMLDKNQEPIPVEIHGKVIFDENGAPILLQGTTRDISERKRSEKMLRESEEKYKSILDNIEDGYYEVDLTGNLTFFNRSLCRVLGYSSSELMGMNNREYMDKENARKVFQTFNRVFETGEPLQSLDWEVIKKDGARCYLNNAVSLIRDTKGNAIGFRGIARDITKHRSAEKENTLLMEQLQQAQKMEAIGTLAGGVAHDFNNLLSIILGYGEMILEDLDKDHPHREPLEEIYQAGVRAKNLTRQLLAFSRKQVLETKVVDVNNVVTGFKKLIGRLIGEDIQLNLSLTSKPLMVKADITQLEQVLMNLAVNARHAMSDGGTLTIETADVELDGACVAIKPSVPTGNYAMIGVSDTGCGMGKETLSRIFEPFFTTKGKEKGTGLGLATSYGIINQHGGNICVSSELNKGTIFKVYLPVCEEAVASQKTVFSTPDNLQGSETILLVEDNEQVRNLSKTILQNQGYTVLIAENGNTALAALERHVGSLNLLLTDMIMPGINGRDLFDRISGLYPNIKVLYMSGYADDIISHRGMLDDGVNFIQKPFSMKTLAAKVRKALDNE